MSDDKGMPPSPGAGDSDARHWARVLSTFDELVDVDPAAREQRLRALGVSNPELRRGVEALLASDADADTRLARVDATFGATPSSAALSPQRTPAALGDPLRLAGRTISHFRVIEPIGAGGMGVVYRAEDVRLQRATALKFLFSVRPEGPNARERFLREARLAGSLDHPNVCGVYETGETDEGFVFFAMPLYDGETLAARIAREGALPVRDALDIARQVTRGLAAAHGAGIIHRDLKPANVMLLRDGTAKILDFGLAKAPDPYDSMTGSAVALGTVAYMAPEQFERTDLDARADLWALGVVLYEMLTGRRPFEGATIMQLVQAVLDSAPELPSALRSEVDEATEALVLRLLEKEPARRCQTAVEVAAALDAIASGSVARSGTVSARVLSGARARWRRMVRGAGARRGSWRLGVAAAAIVATSAGGWFTVQARAGREPGTGNAQALALYRQGLGVEQAGMPKRWRERASEAAIREAQALYARARDLDPEFALARARLARVLVAGGVYDTNRARQEQARIEAEAALRLRPGLAEAHAALAAYWAYGARDVTRAIEEQQRAVAASPKEASLHYQLASFYVNAGRWDDAIASYERALARDPTHALAATHVAFTLLRLRRDAEAMRAFDRALALTPDDHMLRVIRGHTYLRWRGTPDTLAAVLRVVPPDWDPEGMTTWARFTVLRVQRRDREVLAMLDSSRSALSRDGLVYQPTSLMRAQSLETLGETQRARAQYEQARRLLADSVARYPSRPDIRTALALALAGLGRKADAVAEVRRAMDQAPVSQNSPAATAFMGVAVEVYARVGEPDEALKLLELLFAMPAGREVTIPFLRTWPGFDRLRGEPGFQDLLRRFER